MELKAELIIAKRNSKALKSNIFLALYNPLIVLKAETRVDALQIYYNEKVKHSIKNETKSQTNQKDAVKVSVRKKNSKNSEIENDIYELD